MIIRKKWHILITTLVISFSLIMVPMFANSGTTGKSPAESSVVASGSFECGAQPCQWALYNDGTMLFNGPSELSNINCYDDTPIPLEYRQKATTLKFGNSIKTIQLNWFYGFDNVKTVVFSSNLTTIGPEALHYLPLEKVTVPSTVTYLDPTAFMGITSLKTITLNCRRIEQGFGGNPADTIIFGPNVSSIGSQCFQNDTFLRTVVFLGDCDYADSVFRGSEHLFIYHKNSSGLTFDEYIGSYKRVTIPSAVNGYTVNKIGKYAFEGKNRITSITLPSTINSIDSYAFYGCTRLENISMPKELSTIGTFAFYGCNSLTAITIPDTVQTIGEYAFQNCYALKTVSVGEQSTTVADLFFEPAYAASAKKVKINKGAFKGCPKMKSVTIGKYVTKIGSKAFYNCKKLKSIKIKTKKLKSSSIGKNAFKGIYKKATIKVPKSKYKAYKKILKKKGIGKKVKIKKS